MSQDHVNTWVTRGSERVSGSTIVAAHTHLFLDNIFLFYSAHCK
jgi:hypothetical protein